MNNNLLFLDFETRYSSKEGYTLRKMSMTEYIRDPRFKIFGAGYRIYSPASPPGSLPVRGGGEVTEWLSGDDLEKMFRSWNWENITLVAQNAKFDGAILAWHFGIRPARYIDTLALSRAVLGASVASHSLASLASSFGFVPKGDLKTDGLSVLTSEQERELSSYCLHDVDLCAGVYEKLISRFPSSQLSLLDWSIRSFVDPKLALNIPKLEVFVKQEKERRANIFTEIGIDKKTFASNAKFAKLLEEKGYEVPTKKSPRTGKEIPALSLGDIEFNTLQETEDPYLSSLCEARIAAKSTLMETRSEKFLKVGSSGLFPFDVNFSGAVQTHRFSGGNGAGGNPQNLTRGSVLRESIEAPEGEVLIVVDYAAIEARIVAWLAKETRLTNLFSNNGDVYSEFASQLYKRPITKKDKDERAFGKECILGLGYNMGPKKFKNRVKIKLGKELTQEEAQQTVGLYRSYYAKIPLLWETLGNYIPRIAAKEGGRFNFAPFLKYEGGSIILPSGLRLQYPSLRQQGHEWIFTIYKAKRKQPDDVKLYGGKLLENISQALAGEILKGAMEVFYSRWGTNLVGQVHDELILTVREQEAEEALKFIEETMRKSPVWWPEIKLSCEGGVGKNWLSAKK